MAYTNQTFNSGDTITSAWGNKVEKGIAEAHDVLEELSIYKSSMDSNGIYTQVDYKRADTTLYLRSILSGGTSPKYTTRTESYYDTDGTTLLKTITFTISYDTNDNIVSEVKA